jgi:hypothetical protein
MHDTIPEELQPSVDALDYSRQAFREIARIEQQSGRSIRFAFRHFPLTEIHPHALAAAAAGEAAALRDRFWARARRPTVRPRPVQPGCHAADRKGCRGWAGVG